MTQYTRQFEVERASVDQETGAFKAVLFTDGEASDGHILSIKGGEIPEKLPLFVNHNADPTKQLGSLYFSHKTDHEVLVRGEIFLDGEGAEREVRRDILAKMSAGHVSRMSGRWDAEDQHIKRRINLPSDHPAYVDEKKSDSKKQWGLFFEKWVAMEGSVVGLGADPQAVMRWANDQQASEPVRAFWREQVPEAQQAGMVARIAADIRELIAAGIPREEIEALLLPQEKAKEPAEILEAEREVESIEISSDGLEEEETNFYAEHFAPLIERLDAMQAQLAELAKAPRIADEEPERVTPDEPLPSIVSPRQLAADLRALLDVAHEEVIGKFRAEIKKARGKIEESNG